jgi:hypothetical protein
MIDCIATGTASLYYPKLKGRLNYDKYVGIE